MSNKLFGLLTCSIAMTGGLAFSGEAQAPRSPTPSAIEGIVDVETVAEGLEHPWGLAFLPDQRMLVTERPGRLRIATLAGNLSEPLAGVPPVQQGGQGGLLDVQLDPRFQQNGFLYLSFAEPAEDGTAGTSVARRRLVGERLEDVQVIYRQQPKVKGKQHFGSRLVFLRDGTLIVTQGERFDYRNQAQDLTSGLGKIVRINSDGSIPRDNPFADRAPERPEIWSYGHRNVQAATIEPGDRTTLDGRAWRSWWR
ncbi:MAG: PQQ-dependent sugar dehydrogenase [Nitrospira sp.]